MINFHTTLLLLLTLLLVVLGFAVFLRNVKNVHNRLYLLFTLSTAVWVASNGVFQIGEAQFVSALISYGAAGFAALFVLLFNLEFTGYKTKIIKTLVVIIGLIISVLSMLPGFVATGVDMSNQIITTGNLYVYGLYVFAYFAASLVVLTMYRKNVSGLDKIRADLMLFGLSVAIFFGLFFNLFLPLYNIYDLVYLGPAFTLIYIACMGYAVIKHRLFEIRLIIARSIAYSLVIITLGVVYGFAMFGFIDEFFPSTRIGTLQQTIYVISAIFLAFTFQPLKRFFDKITNRIFYRDSYGTQEVLKRVGEVLASEIDLDAILSQTLDVLQDSLKFTHGCFLVVSERKVYKQVTIGKIPSEYPEITDLAELEGDAVITDELEGDQRQLLLNHDIAVVLKLKTQYVTEGYLLLGAKQSGSIYTSQDIQLFNTVSNELAIGIQNAKAYEEIQQFNITLQKRIEAATKELRENNEKLKELDQAKDEFISMASHQLRTPLTTIKGYLSMMLEGDVGKLSKKQQEFVNLAFVRSQRMVYLISDMLNVSRISTGKLTFDKKEFDLAEVVKGEVEQLQRQAEEHEVGLTLHSPEEKSIPITLDEGKIRQVVMNFIDNAIYYAPKGKVDVYLDKKDDFVEFRVVDDGIGVSKEAQEQLFTKFFRAENARHVRPDGTGLGLYMAKQVIEAQNGEIIFQSEEGKGSTFGFRFSLKE